LVLGRFLGNEVSVVFDKIVQRLSELLEQSRAQPRSKNRRSSRIACDYGSHGFSLIELLVVVAIIGILASLLLPAMSRAKSSALQIQCLGQNKQLAAALQMYAQDNREVLPWPNWGSSFQGWLYTPANDAPPQLSAPDVYAGGTLWPYIRTMQVYRCPADPTNTEWFAQRGQQLSSYIMNGATMGYYRNPAVSRTHKLSEMSPSGYATWEPSDQPPYIPAAVFNDGASYPIDDEGPSRRHNSGCNVSSFDGHAQLLKFSSFQEEQLVTPGLLWCDPDTANGTGGPLGRECRLW
jgi:prepilin-type N-terminal cleavage/methylation domain-containing protein/prepilin-type processing-associated H-X9-DG protein